MTTWTKFSERLPEESQEQVWTHWKNEPKPFISQRKAGETWKQYCEMMDGAVAWHPITYPELPKEPTQLDIDNSRCGRSWLEAGTGASLPEFRCGFYAALKYERAEVAKLVASLTWDASPEAMKPLKQLRGRVGLDK